jgi:hypothetical protein
VEFFKNHMVAIVDPRRLTYKGKGYQRNTKFLVEVVLPSGDEEVIPVRQTDYQVRLFAKFTIPQSALKDKASFEEFLSQKVSTKAVNWASFIVIDFEQELAGFKELEDQSIKIENAGWFVVYVIGRILTLWKDSKMRRQNKRTARALRSSRKSSSDR